MINQLLPKQNQFYDLFSEAGEMTVEAAKVLLKMLESTANDFDSLARELRELEHACDDVTHRTITLLNRTFITPLDREDIHELILKIDDVVDLITASGSRFVYFKVGHGTPHAIRLAKQLIHGCEKLASAVRGLRSPKHFEAVERDCVSMHEVENAGDDLLHDALSHLFETEKDPIQVIKWKEIYEMMERVTDRQEDVANILSSITVKMS